MATAYKGGDDMRNDTASWPTLRQAWRNRWAAAIKHARTEVLGISQHALARRLGVGQSTVASWETATGVPEDLIKVRVVDVLGLDAAALLAPLTADTPEAVGS